MLALTIICVLLMQVGAEGAMPDAKDEEFRNRCWTAVQHYADRSGMVLGAPVLSHSARLGRVLSVDFERTTASDTDRVSAGPDRIVCWIDDRLGLMISIGPSSSE